MTYPLPRKQVNKGKWIGNSRQFCPRRTSLGDNREGESGSFPSSCTGLPTSSPSHSAHCVAMSLWILEAQELSWGPCHSEWMAPEWGHPLGSDIPRVQRWFHLVTVTGAHSKARRDGKSWAILESSRTFKTLRLLWLPASHKTGKGPMFSYAP